MGVPLRGGGGEVSCFTWTGLDSLVQALCLPVIILCLAPTPIFSLAGRVSGQVSGFPERPAAPSACRAQSEQRGPAQSAGRFTGLGLGLTPGGASRALGTGSGESQGFLSFRQKCAPGAPAAPGRTCLLLGTTLRFPPGCDHVMEWWALKTIFISKGAQQEQEPSLESGARRRRSPSLRALTCRALPRDHFTCSVCFAVIICDILLLLLF